MADARKQKAAEFSFKNVNYATDMKVKCGETVIGSYFNANDARIKAVAGKKSKDRNLTCRSPLVKVARCSLTNTGEYPSMTKDLKSATYGINVEFGEGTLPESITTARPDAELDGCAWGYQLMDAKKDILTHMWELGKADCKENAKSGLMFDIRADKIQSARDNMIIIVTAEANSKSGTSKSSKKRGDDADIELNAEQIERSDQMALKTFIRDGKFQAFTVLEEPRVVPVLDDKGVEIDEKFEGGKFSLRLSRKVFSAPYDREGDKINIKDPDIIEKIRNPIEEGVEGREPTDLETAYYVHGLKYNRPYMTNAHGIQIQLPTVNDEEYVTPGSIITTNFSLAPYSANGATGVSGKFSAIQLIIQMPKDETDERMEDYADIAGAVLDAKKAKNVEDIKKEQGGDENEDMDVVPLVENDTMDTESTDETPKKKRKAVVKKASTKAKKAVAVKTDSDNDDDDSDKEEEEEEEEEGEVVQSSKKRKVIAKKDDSDADAEDSEEEKVVPVRRKRKIVDKNAARRTKVSQDDVIESSDSSDNEESEEEDEQEEEEDDE